MIKKTNAEKKQLKEAKRLAKLAAKQNEERRIQIKEEREKLKNSPSIFKMDVTVLEGENILPNDYPVNWDYLYVANGKVVRSDVKGTIYDLKIDLIELGKFRSLEEIEIRNCLIEEREKCSRNITH